MRPPSTSPPESSTWLLRRTGRSVRCSYAWYSSVPMIGTMPASRAAWYIGRTPYMFPWSVMPIAGCPSAAAAATTSPMRDAPSSIEYSVWTCRWVNDFATDLRLFSGRFRGSNYMRWN